MAFSFDAVRRTLAGHPAKRLDRPDARWAAVSIIIAPSAEPGILMIRRAVHPKDHWSGHVGLPGGRREDGDADLLATALRETREETGIELARDELLGELDDLGPRSPNAPAIVVRPFVFGLAACPAVSAASDEVASSFWFPLSELRAHGAGKETTVPGMDRPVRAYLLGSNVVWGLTHRIIAQLLERCEPGLA